MLWTKISLVVICLIVLLISTEATDKDKDKGGRGAFEPERKGYDDERRGDPRNDDRRGNGKYNKNNRYKNGEKEDKENNRKNEDKDNNRKNEDKDNKCKNGKGRGDGNNDDNKAMCYASGDPHYKTFDQLYYDFQGDCQYVLTKPCNSDNFSVIVSNKQCNTFVTCTEQVTVLLPTENLKIILGRGRRGLLTINDYVHSDDNDGIIFQSVNTKVLRAGGHLHALLINYGVNIFWNGRNRVEVRVSRAWQTKLCGLCGDYNSDSTNDFRTKDGLIVNSVNVFGNSWQYTDDDDELSNSCNGPLETPECAASDKEKATDACKVLRENRFMECNELVDPEPYIEDCEFDYCNCKDDERDECVCDSLATYAAACAAAGIALKWRDSRFCPLPCPSGMEYQECGSMCPETCDDEDDQSAICTRACVEGCFCPDGKVLSEGNCIDPISCPNMECSGGMVYKTCGPSCPRTCASIETSFCFAICNRGCFCPDDKVLHNGICIDPQLCPGIGGDPHFIVPLLSQEVLCYSIQGYPGLAFNLLNNKNLAINAHFVDSIEDQNEATWIGKLAIVPKNNKSDAVIFDSVNQEVLLIGQGEFKAAAVNQIVFNKDGKMFVKFMANTQNEGKNPTIHVTYAKPLANFDVTFYSHHLNIEWDMAYENASEITGLIGQFMTKNVNIDTQREMLIYSDGRNPIPVIKDTTMTGKPCWKAMNYGNQGEGLIEGNILDYMVSNILMDDLQH